MGDITLMPYKGVDVVCVNGKNYNASSVVELNLTSNLELEMNVKNYCISRREILRRIFVNLQENNFRNWLMSVTYYNSEGVSDLNAFIKKGKIELKPNDGDVFGLFDSNLYLPAFQRLIVQSSARVSNGLELLARLNSIFLSSGVNEKVELESFNMKIPTRDILAKIWCSNEKYWFVMHNNRDRITEAKRKRISVSTSLLHGIFGEIETKNEYDRRIPLERTLERRELSNLTEDDISRLERFTAGEFNRIGL